MNSIGELHLIMGCMYSSKSTMLIGKLLRFRAINKNVFFINSSKDTRASDSEILTHDNITIKACKTDNLMDIVVPYNIHVIGIDEAQFFPDLIPFVTKCLNDKLIIIVAGLDGDYRQQTFGDITKLIPIADTYQKVYSLCKICMDGTQGSFTKRLSLDNNQILVGSDDHYISVCRFHLTST